MKDQKYCEVFAKEHMGQVPIGTGHTIRGQILNGELPASFDWWNFLNQSTYGFMEIDAAAERAASWVFCAVGNQCSIIPRHEDNSAPIDDELFELGIYFSKMIDTMRNEAGRTGMVSDFHRDAAKRCLTKIEKRSSELIAKIKNSQVK